MSNIKQLTIIGAGAMGSAFAKGIIDAGLIPANKITMSDASDAMLERASKSLGVRTTKSNIDAVREADVIMIVVKPLIAPVVLEEIGGAVSTDQLVVSSAAGVKLEVIELLLPDGTGVIRVMPNTPCLVGMGALGFSRGSAATDEQIEIARSIFEAVGIAFEVPERLQNAVTGLSGSGPAYVYLMIEALSDAGVRVGLPRDISIKLASQTVLGAAKMVLDLDEHPARLKDQVTTPGGTTIAALDALEKAGFRSALYEAVKASAKRSEELGG